MVAVLGADLWLCCAAVGAFTDRSGQPPKLADQPGKENQVCHFHGPADQQTRRRMRGCTRLFREPRGRPERPSQCSEEREHDLSMDFEARPGPFYASSGRSCQEQPALSCTWRCRESNPGPSASRQGFSGRSLLQFSRPQRWHRHLAAGPVTVWFPSRPRDRAYRWSLLSMPGPRAEAPLG
jgi:hypothetical protein